MAIPGGPTDQFAERSLVDLAPGDLSPTLQPLYPFRDRLLAIEGLSHTSALADIAAVTRAGSGDLNNHQIGVADVLTGTRALQRTRHVLHRRRAHARSGARHAPLGARALRLARLRLRLRPQLDRLAVLVPRAGAGDADGVRSRPRRSPTCSGT